MPRLARLKFRAIAEQAYRGWQETQPSVIAIDTETHGFSWYDEAFCVTVSYTDLFTVLGATGGYFELENEETHDLLREMLLGTETWVFHNAKFDLQKLIYAGVLNRPDITAERIEDTWAMSVLLDELRPSHKLGDLAVDLLGIEDFIEVEIQSGKNKGKTKRVPREDHVLGKVRRKWKLRKDDGYGVLPREVVMPYAIKDTNHTILLYEHLHPKIQAIPELDELYQEEKELILTLLDMEARGFAIDVPYLEKLKTKMGRAIVRGEKRLREMSGIEDFNPGSPKQVAEALAARGVDVLDTRAETLKQLDDEFAQALLDWRKEETIYTRYVLGLLEETRGGIFHPSHLPFGTKTGRMSSSTKGD